MIRNTQLGLVPLILVLGVAFAQAGSISLAPSQDNTLYERVNGEFSNGIGESFFAGKTQSGKIRRALLAFDIASVVPAGATITSVDLTLSMTKAPPIVPVDHPTSLHRLLSDWGEGASDAGTDGGAGATAAAGDATWIHTFSPGSTWTTAGGDFSASASATQGVSTNPGPVTWTSTPDLVADVQAWLDAPASNFGWIVLGDESQNQTARQFGSRENGVTANQPSLAIEYTVVPEPTGIALMAMGTLAFLSRRRRACSTQ